MGAIAATDKKKYEYLDKGDSDGCVIGQSPTKKVGMYGFTPVVQAATIASVASIATDAFDATVSTGAIAVNAMIVKLNALLDDLSDLGINASA